MFGYIRAHWQGNQSLVRSYWVNGAILGALFYLATIYLSTNTAVFESLIFDAIFVSFSLALSVWTLVGIWRSANAYKDSAKHSVPKRSPFWGYAAQVIVVLGTFRAVSDFWPLLHDLDEMRKLAQSDISTQYYVELSGETDVILNGYINSKSSGAVLDAFKDRRRNALVLNSPGGLLKDAYTLADFVEENGIITAANGNCISACLLVLASSYNAMATPDSVLAFHHPEAAGDFVSDGATISLSDEIAEYYKRFREYGVPDDELKRLREQGMTRLSLAQAYNLYIVDTVWLPESQQFLDVEEYCKDSDCFTLQ